MVNICSGKCNTEDGVNDMFHKFTQVLTDIAEPLFGKSYNVARSTTSSLPKWMSDECKNLRDAFFNNLKQYRQNETDECRKNMIRSRSAYTRCARSCRREYDHAFMKNILKQKVDVARLYWQLLDKLDSNRNTGNSNLTADEFIGYFKSLYNQEDVSTQVDDAIYEYLNENLNNDTMFEELNNTLDVDEVKNAIRELKTGRAAGHNLIINEL